ncbi:MAG: pilus assembly protein PilM, partial [Planctomycetales bacterium]|nr:pilus assembly protein PilM [Planctomycetales bacterium]
QLLLEQQFERARLTLGAVAILNHPQLEKINHRFRQLRRAVDEERERAEKQRDQVLVDAGQLLDSGEFKQALDMLISVPPEVRDDDIAELMCRAQEKLGECYRLRDEIKEAVKSQQLDNLLERVLKFLKLKPADAGAQQLAMQLSQRNAAQAKELMKRHEYAAARELLDAIPRFAESEPIESLSQELREYEFLSSYLATAPYFDNVIVLALDRLRRTAAKHPELPGWLERAKQIQAESAREGGVQTLAWSPASPQSPRAAINWERPRRLLRTSMGTFQMDKEFAKTCPRMYVVIGTALHALGFGSVSAQMDANPSHGIRKHLGGLVRKKIPKSAWGIEVGSTGLKAVRLEREQPDAPPRIVDYIVIETKSTADGDGIADKLAALLRAFSEKADLKVDRVCMAMPSDKLLVRTLRLPATDPRKLVSAVDLELKHRIPYAAEELSMVRHIFDSQPDAKDDTLRNAIGIASRVVHVEELATAFTDASGQRLDGLIPENIALHTLLTHDLIDSDKERAIGMLYLGANSSLFVCGSSYHFISRSFSVGTRTFSQLVARRFKTTHETANKLIFNPAPAKRLSAFYDAIEPGMALLEKELKQSLQSYNSEFAERPLSRIIVAGGGGDIVGLMNQLARSL